MILEPLKFELTEGNHVIEFYARTDDVTIGDLTVKNSSQMLDYNAYLSQYDNESKYDLNMTLQAENYQYKSDPSIKAYSDTDIKVVPYNVKHKMINSIDAYTWDEAGKSITWEVNVEKTGLYQMSFKYMQYRLTDLPVFRQIKINGEVPFEDLDAYAFQYTSRWANETLHNDQGSFWVYLEAGQNDITLTSTVEPYNNIIRSVENSMNKITNLAILIRQLTGGVTDVNRDWDLIEYIPTISDDLYLIADELENAYAYGNSLNQQNEAASGLVNLKYAIENLRKLASEPNQIPNNLSMLSEGTESVNQYLGDLLVSLTKQSLALDQFFIHGENADIPNAQANFISRIWNGIVQLFYTFVSNDTTQNDDENTINIWVNKSRAHIDLLQQMIDQEFTPDTGIKVNLSLMPNENKLIASLAAGKEPDMVLGVSQNKPYEFAVRGASVDLRTFEGYEELIASIPKGTLLPYIIDEGVYGVPDSLDFYLMYYRSDILQQLDIELPRTWEEMYAILPKLQRYGMNFYVPIGSKVSYKSFTVTSPFFYQNNASLYDGMFSGIGSENGYEAMKQMTELFTLYNLPKQVSSFYNQFRYGLMPIGIANSASYIQLLIAAPEIKGNWDVANVLGNETEDGIDYDYAVTSTASMIFKTSENKEEAFELLKWWLETDTQVDFANDLQTTFGKEYIWFSSNYEALKQLPLSSSHVDIILSQVAAATSVPNIPGSYFLEREISDAWSRVMYNGESLRNAVDTAIINADREIERKMTEFGYMKDGLIIDEYKIPTIETIDHWLTGKDESDEYDN
jgi:ABC-type glycerol-3-phosphate transport system substrate-binding protein